MYLPSLVVGYRKEQIKVQMDKYGKLKISGERPLEDNRWSRFRKEFQIPENCNVSDIRAKFENGHLYVVLPKLITEVKGQEEPTQAPQKPKESEKPMTEPKPSTAKDDMNQKGPVKPNGVEKKQEDEKRGEQIDARKDVEKMEEKEKDQTEEKKYKEKITGVVKHEEGEKGDAVSDAQKKEVVSEPAAAAGNGRNGEGKLKQKLDELLDLGCYDARRITVNTIVAAVVMIGMGLYVSYKLSTMKEDGN